MAFRPINFDEGQLVELPMTAATYTKGQALIVTSGYYITAGSAPAVDIPAVCMEDVTISVTGQKAKCIRTEGVVFEADTNATPVIAASQGVAADMTNATTVNEASTSDNIFFIERCLLPLTDKKVIGWFTLATPNS